MSHARLVIITVTIIAIFFAVWAGFFGSELIKKFGYQTQFTNYQEQGSYVQKIPWNYSGDWAEKPGMKTITFKSSKPFAALIGLNLKTVIFEAYDYYGFVQSHAVDGGYATSFSTYLGKDPIEFIFLIKKEGPQQEIYHGYDQVSEPDATYPPHPWQPLSDYAAW